jgi:hypothetical protein
MSDGAGEIQGRLQDLPETESATPPATTVVFGPSAFAKAWHKALAELGIVFRNCCRVG